MAKRGAKSGQNVVGQEPLPSPDVFYGSPEHPYSEHVKEQVCEVAMHEHVGHELPHTESLTTPIMQPEKVIQIDALGLEDDCSKKKYSINNQNIFNHFGKDGKTSRSVFLVIHFMKLASHMGKYILIRQDPGTRFAVNAGGWIIATHQITYDLLHLTKG
jgi:hypothetical protein